MADIMMFFMRVISLVVLIPAITVMTLIYMIAALLLWVADGEGRYFRIQLPRMR